MGRAATAQVSTWKAVERAVAEILGGERVPVTGRARGSAPDIAHESLAIEVKHRKAMPAWLLDAMAQAVASKRAPEQLPIVVLHPKGARYVDSLVIVRLGDLAAIE